MNITPFIQRRAIEAEGEEIQPKPLSEKITPVVQRQEETEEEEEEEETIQTKPISSEITSVIQRQGEPEEEEEPIQSKLVSDQITPLIQKQAEPEEEEELIQTKPISEQITPLVQRQPLEEEEELLQAKEIEGKTPKRFSYVESSIQSFNGAGRPLSKNERNFFEPRFGADFSKVRIHTNSKAADSARAVNAKAFTVGRDVVFGAGHYKAETMTGKGLLAHELAHVVQQDIGITHTQTTDLPNIIINSSNLSKREANVASYNILEHRHSDLSMKSSTKLSPITQHQLQRRVINEEYATTAFETGPLWDVYLKIWRAPEEDTEFLKEFILECENGVKSAIEWLGSGEQATSRTIKIEVPYRHPLYPMHVREQCETLAINSVLKEAVPQPSPPEVRFRPPQTPEEKIATEVSRAPRGPKYFDDDIISVHFDFWGDIFHVRLINGRTLSVHRSNIHREGHPGGDQILAFVHYPEIDRSVSIACTKEEIKSCKREPEQHLWINREWSPRFMDIVDHIDNVLVPESLEGIAVMYESFGRVVELMLILETFRLPRGAPRPRRPISQRVARLRAYRSSLINELKRAGIKFTEAEIQFITRTPTGRIVWLEMGTAKAGLKHIMTRHGDDFARIGLRSEGEIQNTLLRLVQNETPISTSGGASVYRVFIGSIERAIRIVIGDNGFIVTAHPVPL